MTTEFQKIYGEIDFPPEYPEDIYAKFYEKALLFFDAPDVSSNTKNELGYAMKSLAYRYKTCVESGKTFSNSVVDHGDAPKQPHRYIQERELFSFITAGLACLEAIYYALFTWGSSVAPDIFKFSTENHKRSVTIKSTVSAFKYLPNSENIIVVLERLPDFEQYAEWKQYRNVFAHRGIPGRIMYAAFGSASKKPSRYHDFGQLEGIEVTPEAFETMEQWLTQSLQELLQEAIRYLAKFEFARGKMADRESC